MICKYNLMVPANRKQLPDTVFLCAAAVKIAIDGTGQY
jgi:hypothetical protein